MALSVLPFTAQLALAALMARGPVRRARASRPAANTRFVVVVPAHDEEASIEATLAHIARSAYPRDRLQILVIADNCTDQTAPRARACGVTVLERTHRTDRGKGHALAFASHWLLTAEAANGWDALVVVDADSVVDPMMLGAFAHELEQGRTCLQAYYTVSNPAASWRTGLLTYALALINGSYGAGLDAMGLGAPLRGNGMCFAKSVVLRLPWDAFGLAEDLEYSWHLRLAGERVRAVPRAVVAAEMVSTAGAAAAGQRQRWELGRRSLRQLFLRRVCRHAAWPLPLRAAFLIDLYMPPLARLGAALSLSLVLHACAAGRAGAVAPTLALLQGVLAVCLAIYATSAFWAMALPVKYGRYVAAAPLYGLWKALLLCRRRPGGWVRTPREPTDTGTKK